jgi:hypothetical protein
MKAPPLPALVMGMGGPITVELCDKLVDEDGAHCLGLWIFRERRIKLERHKDRAQVWATFYHELVHAALDDSGLSNLLTEPQQEALCDALANARMRERFG